ncbi:hypothetical protein FQN57_001964 [Myotisia sp. PD_48]|nr:hypothetical protein FQN57_001964 [Myotisia sp. PD_48]
MDPLSNAASVLTIIQVAGILVKYCGAYLAKVKSAKQDILNLQQKLQGLLEILESLDKLLTQRSGAKLSTTKKIYDNVTKCLSALTNLRNKIDPETTQKPMRRLGLRSLKWPLQRTEVDEAILDIEKYKSSFSLALQIDQRAQIDHIDQKIDLSRLPTAKGAEFDAYENQHDECLEGTRSELLHCIEEWAESPDGKCIFWLNGMAGTGKSTISRTVASLLKKRNLLGASFFFKRGEQDRGNAKRLFPTLVRQLAVEIPELIPNIQKLMEDDPYISEKALGEQFSQLFLQPVLRTDLGRTTTLVIVIDALDEYEPEGNKDDARVLLKLLPQVQSSKCVQLRFFLTSRPELPIRLGFKEITDDFQDVDLHDMPNGEITRDIALFLKDEFKKIRKDHELESSWPGDEAIQALILKAVPLFIYATTICRFIGDRNWSPQNRLHIILEDQTVYVSKMSSTYLPVLNQLLRGQDEWESQLVQEFKDIVGVIIVLATPLSVNSLSRLLDMETTSIKRRLNLLHSVLGISNDLAIPVKVLHQSFRDFLLDAGTKRAKNSEKFWIDEKAVHRDLTNKCLELMQFTLKKNICELQDEGTQHSDISIHSINQHLPLELQYACRYWPQHLIQSQDLDTGIVKAFSFLKIHFLHWVEAMSLLGLVTEILRALKTLQSAIQEGNKHYEILEFLQDANRFILTNRYVIGISPLQIYSAGLMFTPHGSITRKMFSNEIPSWLHQLPNVEESWSSNTQILEGHQGIMESLAFSLDSQFLASGSRDGTVKLWDPNTGELQYTLICHSMVWLVAFSPDSRLVASVCDDTIMIWDLTTGLLQHTLEGHHASVVAFSLDSIASSSKDMTIKLWNPMTGELQHTLKGHSSPIRSLAFSLDYQLLASGSEDGSIKLWGLMKGKPIGKPQRTLEGHSSSVISLAFSRDSLASASEGGINLWDPTTAEPQQILDNCTTYLSMSFSMDSRVLAASTCSGFTVWDLTTGKVQNIVIYSFDAPLVAISPDGQLLASAGLDSEIKLWDLSRGELRDTYRYNRDTVWSLAFSPDSQLLASGFLDGGIKLWDPTTGRFVRVLYGHSDRVNSVAFSPDSQLLASASDDKTIKLWVPTTGQLQHTLEGHSDWVLSVAFSPDGKLLASGSRDRTIKLWDPTLGWLHSTLKAPHQEVTLLVFSPDGQLLVSVCKTTTVNFWNPTTGWLFDTDTFTYYCSSIHSVEFSSDNQLLVSSNTKCWDSTTTWKLQESIEEQGYWSIPDTNMISILENRWVCVNGKKRLWLPHEYRFALLAIRNGTLCIGTQAGDVIFISGFIE